MRRSRLLLLSPPFLWLLAALWLDLQGCREPAPLPYAAIVVAGCRVHADGTPSQCLRDRTTRAVLALRAHPGALLVLTGGVGVGTVSEAQAAANLALTLGVSPDQLRVEARSTSTWENAAYAAALLGEGMGPVLVVTDSYHVWRSRRVFEHHFDRVEALAVQPGPKRRSKGALREVAAALVYGSRGWL